jgi:hypothetical protein
VAAVDLEHLTDQTLALLAVLVVGVHVSAQVVELAQPGVMVEEQPQVKEILVALVNQPHTHMAVAVILQVLPMSQ